jgi:hypothetical protein
MFRALALATAAVAASAYTGDTADEFFCHNDATASCPTCAINGDGSMSIFSRSADHNHYDCKAASAMHACLSNEACCCYTHSLGGCNKEFTHMNKKVVLSAGDQCIAEEVDEEEVVQTVDIAPVDCDAQCVEDQRLQVVEQVSENVQGAVVTVTKKVEERRLAEAADEFTITWIVKIFRKKTVTGKADQEKAAAAVKANIEAIKDARAARHAAYKAKLAKRMCNGFCKRYRFASRVRVCKSCATTPTISFAIKKLTQFAVVYVKGKPCRCTREYKPVCARVGWFGTRKYSNACLGRCEGAKSFVTCPSTVINSIAARRRSKATRYPTRYPTPATTAVPTRPPTSSTRRRAITTFAWGEEGKPTAVPTRPPTMKATRYPTRYPTPATTAVPTRPPTMPTRPPTKATTAPCPVVRCSAPGFPCKYIKSSTLNSRGCLVFPCGILSCPSTAKPTALPTSSTRRRAITTFAWGEEGKPTAAPTITTFAWGEEGKPTAAPTITTFAWGEEGKPTAAPTAPPTSSFFSRRRASITTAPPTSSFSFFSRRRASITPTTAAPTKAPTTAAPTKAPTTAAPTADDDPDKDVDEDEIDQEIDGIDGIECDADCVEDAKATLQEQLKQSNAIVTIMRFFPSALLPKRRLVESFGKSITSRRRARVSTKAPTKPFKAALTTKAPRTTRKPVTKAPTTAAPTTAAPTKAKKLILKWLVKVAAKGKTAAAKAAKAAASAKVKKTIADLKTKTTAASKRLSSGLGSRFCKGFCARLAKKGRKNGWCTLKCGAGKPAPTIATYTRKWVFNISRRRRRARRAF